MGTFICNLKIKNVFDHTNQRIFRKQREEEFIVVLHFT